MADRRRGRRHPADERDWARDYASYVLTNPDLLHHSVLPAHARWRGLLQSLRYVVIDEAHRYRGVFGAQVAAVLRRLRRLAAHYGARPTFVLASATATDAVATAGALLGVSAGDIALVDRDFSARGSIDISLWQPDGPAEDDTADLLAGRWPRAGRPSPSSRPGGCARSSPGGPARSCTHPGCPVSGATRMSSSRRTAVAIWPRDRRRLEADLQSGRLRGIAATNALELGVDIAGVDAVIICGYPGSRAAWWQQAGRAGRRGRDAQVTLVARRQPVDAYLLDHPETLFDAAVEATVLHPDNPYVLGPQLAAAAQELPITEADRSSSARAGLAMADDLARRGVLRRRPGGYFWTRPERAVDRVDLRAAAGDSVDIVE